MHVQTNAADTAGTPGSAAFKTFPKILGMTGVGRTSPYPDPAEEASLPIANDRIVVSSGSAENAYIRLR